MNATIVISAVALESGGILSILQDCLTELSDQQYKAHRIYVIIKDKFLVGEVSSNINFIELDGSQSYLRKFYYEYFYFKKLSLRLKPDVWISMHDVTPNVSAKCRVVYCHNPATFYRISLSEFLLDPKFGLFTWFYWFFYKKNLHKNSWVIVQQSWIREEFYRRFGMAKNKIIVAHPNVFFSPPAQQPKSQPRTIFFYPTYPRVFKNIELICEATNILNGLASDFEIVLTVDGTENGYARWLKLKYGHLLPIKWLGRQTRAVVYKMYSEADALVFPSRLETWGLPISEFKITGKPILVAALPYAKETVGDYDKALFFDPFDYADLADKMRSIISEVPSFAPIEKDQHIAGPAASDWTALFSIILPKSNG